MPTGEGTARLRQLLQQTGIPESARLVVHRFRRDEQVSQFVGRYRYRLRLIDGRLRIALREAILDSQELGSLGAVSFIL